MGSGRWSLSAPEREVFPGRCYPELIAWRKEILYFWFLIYSYLLTVHCHVKFSIFLALHIWLS